MSGITAVVGPTAAGKSELAVEIARRWSGEILSVDSMQVYRGMDIGTAKPADELRASVPHHLIDLADPAEELTVADFRRRGVAVLDELAATGIAAVVAGGSGLHFRSLVDPMSMVPGDPRVRRRLEGTRLDDLVDELVSADPAAADHVDLSNRRRVVRAVEVLRVAGITPSRRAATPEHRALREYRPQRPFVAVGVDPGDRLPGRITRRFDAMLASGLLDEVALLAPRLGRTAAQAVGYKELLPVVAGEVSPEEGRLAAIRATRRLAKRQRTFFRRDPRIRWIAWDDDPGVRLGRALDILDGERAWTS